MSLEKAVSVKINGVARQLSAPANETLLDCLRRHGHFEVKSGCEKGDCGACASCGDGECGEGDLVTIVETRPLSKRKRWRVRSIDRKAVG